jgi:hypothetical protein
VRWLTLVAVVAVVLVAEAGPARADVTPGAFGGCARADGERLYRSSGLPAAIEQQLGADFTPATEVIGVQRVRCVDLTDDGVEEMLLSLAGPTVSSPEPWAILRASSTGPPRLAFLRADVGYVSLAVLRAGTSRAVVRERQKTLRSSDFNCCPSGPTKTRYVRWTGRRFRLGSAPTGGSERPDPPPGPAGDPGPAPPQPSGGPGCEGVLRVGPVDLRVTCPRRQADGSYVASGRVRINGIDLVPADGDVEVVLDPKTLELRTTGSVRVQAGPVVLY